MLTYDFQKFLIFLFAIAFISLIAYGLYCKRKSNSYIGTGRVTEIEAYNYKATLVWITAFCITIGMIMKFV